MGAGAVTEGGELRLESGAPSGSGASETGVSVSGSPCATRIRPPPQAAASQRKRKTVRGCMAAPGWILSGASAGRLKVRRSAPGREPWHRPSGVSPITGVPALDRASYSLPWLITNLILAVIVLFVVSSVDRCVEQHGPGPRLA